MPLLSSAAPSSWEMERSANRELLPLHSMSSSEASCWSSLRPSSASFPFGLSTETTKQQHWVLGGLGVIVYKQFAQYCTCLCEVSAGPLSHRCDIITLSSASSLLISGSASSSSLLYGLLLASESERCWEFWLMGVRWKPSSSRPASKSMMAWSLLPSARRKTRRCTSQKRLAKWFNKTLLIISTLEETKRGRMERGRWELKKRESKKGKKKRTEYGSTRVSEVGRKKGKKRERWEIKEGTKEVM